MSMPYERILSHVCPPMTTCCGPCQAQAINHPCSHGWCHCSCRLDGATSEPVYTDTEFPEFPEFPAIPQFPTVPEPALLRHPDAQTRWAWNSAGSFTLPEPAPRRPARMRIRRFIAHWEIPFAIFTVVLYAAALGLVALVFPNVSNLWVSLFVLFAGFTSSMLALASILKTRE